MTTYSVIRRRSPTGAPDVFLIAERQGESPCNPPCPDCGGDLFPAPLGQATLICRGGPAVVTSEEGISTGYSTGCGSEFYRTTANLRFKVRQSDSEWSVYEDEVGAVLHLRDTTPECEVEERLEDGSVVVRPATLPKGASTLRVEAT